MADTTTPPIADVLARETRTFAEGVNASIAVVKRHYTSENPDVDAALEAIVNDLFALAARLPRELAAGGVPSAPAATFSSGTGDAK